LYAVVFILIAGGVFFIFHLGKKPEELEKISSKTYYDDPSDSLTNKIVSDGSKIFRIQCGSCHAIGIDMTGPDLVGVTERGPWRDTSKLYNYIKDPISFKQNKYIDSLRKRYKSKHMAFPDLKNHEMEAILLYIRMYRPKAVV